jgi:hypothetical protein
MMADTDVRLDFPRRLLAAAGLLPNAPGCGVNIFLDLCRRGLVPGRVVAADALYSAVVTAALASSSGDVVVFPPRSIAGMPLPDARLREDWDRGMIATHLADRWADVETTVEGALPLIERRVSRLRRLDDLFAADRSCRLLVCADPPYNLEILTGGEALLERTKPLILFETAGAEAAEAATLLTRFDALMRSMDYVLLDGDYFPLTDAASIGEALVVGRSSAFLGVPRDLAGAFDIGAAATRADFAAGFAAMRPQPRAPRQVICDDKLPAQGLYPAETAKGVTWRWSGPGRRCRILLPVSQPGEAVVACYIVSGYARGQEITAIRAAGADLKYSVTFGQAGAAIVRFAVAVPHRGFRGWIDLEIEHLPTKRPAGADSFRLGLCFRSFVIAEGLSNIAAAGI